MFGINSTKYLPRFNIKFIWAYIYRIFFISCGNALAQLKFAIVFHYGWTPTRDIFNSRYSLSIDNKLQLTRTCGYLLIGLYIYTRVYVHTITLLVSVGRETKKLENENRDDDVKT